MNPTRCTLALCAATLIAATVAAHAADKESLKESFKNRHDALVALKVSGTVGETAQGYVEAVNNAALPAPAQALVSAENGDRKALYALLAAEQNTPEPEVARQNAIFKFKVAGNDEFFKGKDGVWRRKRDMLSGS